MAFAATLQLALALGALSVSVAPGTPCVDEGRLAKRLAEEHVTGQLQVRVRAEGDALVVEGERANQPALRRRIPIGRDGCAPVERVVVALLTAWARPPVPVLSAQGVDGGAGSGSTARGPGLVAMDAGAPNARPDAGVPTSSGLASGPIARGGDGGVERSSSEGRGAVASTAVASPAPASTSGSAGSPVTAATGTASPAPRTAASPSAAATTTAATTPAGTTTAATTTAGTTAATTPAATTLATKAPAATPSATTTAATTTGATTAATTTGPTTTGATTAATTTGPTTTGATTAATTGAATTGAATTGAATTGAATTGATTTGAATTGATTAATTTAATTTAATASAATTPTAASPAASAPASTPEVAISRVRATPSPPWSLGVSAFGGVASGPTAQATALGSILVVVSRSRWGLALEGGLESAVTQSIPPGQVWASTQWGSLGPSVSFRPASAWRLDALLAFRVTHIAAAAEGFPVNDSASLVGFGGVASGGVARHLTGPLWAELRAFVSARAPAERLFVSETNGALVLGSWQFGALLGLRLEAAIGVGDE